jgi:hypothetical protein
MYCHIEGVNFDQTVFDTQDIATIRGSSLLLEELGDQVEKALEPFAPAKLEFGASKALFKLGRGTEAGISAAIASFAASSPWCHLSLVYGVKENPTKAKCAAAIMQYQTWTVPNPGEPGAAGSLPDVLDLTRPSQVEIDHPGGGKRWVSHSVAERRSNGTRKRPAFLNRENFRHPTDFDEILSDAGVSEQIANKLAVIAADGIGGGKLRELYGDGAEFSEAMADMRAELAEALNLWAINKGAHVISGDKLVPRFDALLWGGDDMTFVMPAWLALPFLEVFFRVTEGYTFKPKGHQPQRLYHRAACIIANKKTPIRQMRALASNAEWELSCALKMAKQSQDEMKPANCGVFSVDVFESAALPHAEIIPYRTEQYGSKYKAGMDMFASTDVGKVIGFCRDISSDDESSLTRTLLHGALESLWHDGRAVLSVGKDDPVEARLRDYFRRVQVADDVDARLTALIHDFSERPRPLALVLAQAAQLLPYTEFKLGEEV